MEEIRILTIGDVHFKTNNVKESAEMCEKIYQLVNTENLDGIINMGDSLHNHERIHMVPLTNATNYILKLAEMKKNVENILLIGNHDYLHNNAFLSNYHPFTGFKGIDNLTVVDKVIIKEIKGMKFCFVPYVYPGRLFEAIYTNKNINENNIKEFTAFFGHQEIYGTTMGAMTSVSGDKWPIDYPYFISGHIHDYCRPQENVVYVGTPMQHAFGDRDDKTVSIWTISPNKPPVERRIDLGLTKRIIVELKSTEVLTWKPQTNCLTKLIISIMME